MALVPCFQFGLEKAILNLLWHQYNPLAATVPCQRFAESEELAAQPLALELRQHNDLTDDTDTYGGLVVEGQKSCFLPLEQRQVLSREAHPAARRPTTEKLIQQLFRIQ